MVSSEKLVFCFILFCMMSTNVTSHECGERSGRKFARFPNYNEIMTMEEFYYLVVNRTLNEFYLGAPNPPPFLPANGFMVTATKGPGMDEYLLLGKGQSRGDNPSCITVDRSLQHGLLRNRAFFIQSDEPTVRAFVSHCPTSYIIIVQCEMYDYVRKLCPIDSTFINVYLQTSIDDVPINDLAEEICRITGVEMGAQDLKWFFTYGNLC